MKFRIAGINLIIVFAICWIGFVNAQSSTERGLVGTVINITNHTSGGINWLQVCRNPIVDREIIDSCESLTTPDGYFLTQDGNRVIACILGANVLLAYDPTGVTLGEAQGIAKTTGICG